MAGAAPSPRDDALRRAITALSILELIAERLATLARPPASGEAAILRRHAADLVALARAEIRAARASRAPARADTAAPPPVVRTPERSVRTAVRNPARASRAPAPAPALESKAATLRRVHAAVAAVSAAAAPSPAPPPPPPLRVPLAKRRGRRPGFGAMAQAAAERREADLQRVAAATLPPGVATAAKLHLQRRGDGVTGGPGAWSVNGLDPIDDAALVERARRHGFDPAGVRPVLRVLAAE